MRVTKDLNIAFYISLAIKALDGLLETVAGIFVWIGGIKTLNYFAVLATRHELLEDPTDIVANWVVKAATDLSTSTVIFIVFFLLSHGIIKLFLATVLFLNKIWAYPLTIILFSLAVIVQIIQLYNNFSSILLSVTIIDMMVVWIIWKKYKTVSPGDNK